MDSDRENISGSEDSVTDEQETALSESVQIKDCTHFRGKMYKDLTSEDLFEVEFDTIEEVESFYSCYSLAKGFGMRKDRLDKNRAGTIVLRRDIVCSKEGERKESDKKDSQTSNGFNSNKKRCTSTRRVSRENCPAKIIARHCARRGVYYVDEFITEHNHPLAKPEHRQFVRAHRHVRKNDLAQANALRKVSVRICRAYEYMVHQAGGYEFVGFTLKDLYNARQGEKAEIMMDGDAQSAITWMNMKAMQDPLFYCMFSKDEEGRLANMFWRDGQSLTDYNAFGDVLIFDSTYKSNIYGKPLVVFVGCNNHRATVLFGCALLVDETEESYNWALTAFLNSMNKKKPGSVITDGDDAMHNAVRNLIPEARHRLCSWHIGKNVCQHLKNVDTQNGFFHLIFAGLTIPEWESQWHYFVTMNGLEDNEWVTSMYHKRERWAEAFFRDHFFGGICSTQRCEGMHRILKEGNGRHMRLFELLPLMEKIVERIRNRVLHDDYRSDQFHPVYVTHMRQLEKETGEKFTHDVFLLIRDQIKFEDFFVVTDVDVDAETGASMFMVSQYEKPERRWIVTCNNDQMNVTFLCSCQLFESDGIPCCHIFSVLKRQMRTTLPDSLVKKRWTKEASVRRTSLNSGLANDNAVQIARYGDLMSACAKFCHLASFSDEGYEETKDMLSQLTIHAQKYRVRDRPTFKLDSCDGLHPNVIKDPMVCKSKGTKSKTCNGKKKKRGKRCGTCKKRGHNSRTCARNAKGKKTGGDKDKGSSSAEAAIELTGSSSSDGDASSHEMDETTETSDADDEEDMVSGNPTTDLFHHREESRRFEFFSGSTDIGDGRKEYPNYFEHFRPFHDS